MTPGELNQQSIEKTKRDIDQMNHYQMAHLYRFAPSGHPYFISDTEANRYFMMKFNAFGGMTSEMSKAIGW